MTRNMEVKQLPHHHQLEFCITRAKYRQGRKLSAVKVYTVNDESKYLILNGVPAIKISGELETLCQRYGDIEYLNFLPDYPHEDYVEVFLVKYKVIKNARFAKKQLDGKSFYGGVLHVCYAPELETVEETREKLQERRGSIAALTKRLHHHHDSAAPTLPSMVPRATRRYMSQLRPELREEHLEELHPRVQCSQATESAAGAAPVALHPREASQPSVVHSERLTVSGNVTAMSDIAAAGNTRKTQSSEGKIDAAVTQAEDKRPINSLTLLPNKKKIRLFGNQNLLSYKSDSGSEFS